MEEGEVREKEMKKATALSDGSVNSLFQNLY